MINTTGCKAKNPSACPYHGAALRMEEAQVKGDFEAYFAARTDFEKAEKKIKKSFGLFSKEKLISEPIPAFNEKVSKEVTVSVSIPETKSVPSSEDEERIKAEAERKLKSQQMFTARYNYLNNAEAIPTPMEAYALWLSVYESQGGKVRNYMEQDYETPYKTFGKNNTAYGKLNEDDLKPEYSKIGFSRWTPTKSVASIPAGYGSAALELLILPDAVNQPLIASGEDRRKGWEWGHTQVFILEKTDDSPSGFFAHTNQQQSISTYKDVESYRKGKTIKQLMESLASKPKPVNPELN